MTIELIEITPGYLPDESGKYLVKTKTSMGEQFLQARVIRYQNEKGEWKYAIDVSGQTPTHISTKPVL